ncbi:MAG: SUF system NifU family Fe-S cluster assembly protein [Anaerolineales bacterium]|nr:SUF system NifU family Fe-S cluster assembly protein [Anaerolineales bacterium]
MDDLYRAVIVDRYKHPRMKQTLQSYDFHYEDHNPLCGDQMVVYLKMDESGTITDAGFEGEGCAISQASADLLLESLIGKTVEDVKGITKDDILDMLGIELGPVRLKCALLSLKVTKAAIYGLDSLEEELH